MDRSDTSTGVPVGDPLAGVPADAGSDGVDASGDPGDGTRPAVDVAALRRVLDGPHRELREQIRASQTGSWFTPRRHDSTDAHRSWVTAAMHEIARTPHQLVGFPREYGGRDAVGASVAAFEMLALGDLSLTVKSGVQWGLFGGAVQALGTKTHHDRYLPSIMDFSLPGCFAMTETGHGSDVQSLCTTATYDPTGEEFVVHTPDLAARKDYIGNAARDGRLAVVFARLVTDGRDHGVHALLVPIRDEHGNPVPGVTIEDDGDKMGLAGVDNGRLSFDQVRVPREALLDRYATVAADGTYASPIGSTSGRFFTMLGALVRGRVSIAGAALSAAKVGLDIAVRYGQSRRQFVDPASGHEIRLLDHPAHQRKLLPPLARAYAFTFAQAELVEQLQQVHEGGVPISTRRRLEANAAAVKAGSTWNATATLQTAREACGGAGYLATNRLPGLKADTDVFTTFEGDNTVLMQLVAKGLLTAYARRARGPVGAVRTLARSARSQARDALPARPLGSRLRDPEEQVRLLVEREEHMVDGLARRLRGLVAAGTGRAEAAALAQEQMVELGHAHVDRLLVQAFARAVEQCEDPGAAEVLATVRDLFVVTTVESTLGWFLAHRRMTRADARRVPVEVQRLCAELRPVAVELVDAFGIDEAWAGRIG